MRSAAEATTSSLEALKAYSAALRIHASSGAIAPLPLFKRATEIDPQFATAHAWLGRAYADLDESDFAAESMGRGWQLRDRTSDRENLWITTAYHTLVTGNMEKRGRFVRRGRKRILAIRRLNRYWPG